MKTTMRQVKCLIILFLAIGSFAGCKDDDDHRSVDEDSMAEYFRCKVNGADFRANSNWGCQGTIFGYYPEASNGISAGYMIISGKDCVGNGNSVKLRFYGFDAEVGAMDFVHSNAADSVSPMFRVNIDEKYEQLISGSMNLTHFRPRELPDGKLGLVQGTFECVLSNDTSDVEIHITEGEFRFRVQESW